MADEMMVKELEEVGVRFSGDSGDGMQLEMTSVHFPIIRQISVLRKGH